jgi:hypothetical protein
MNEITVTQITGFLFKTFFLLSTINIGIKNAAEIVHLISVNNIVNHLVVAGCKNGPGVPV